MSMPNPDGEFVRSGAFGKYYGDIRKRLKLQGKNCYWANWALNIPARCT